MHQVIYAKNALTTIAIIAYNQLQKINVFLAPIIMELVQIIEPIVYNAIKVQHFLA